MEQTHVSLSNYGRRMLNNSLGAIVNAIIALNVLFYQQLKNIFRLGWERRATTSA
jgi:hypothetical protein